MHQIASNYNVIEHIFTVRLRLAPTWSGRGCVELTHTLLDFSGENPVNILVRISVWSYL